MNEKKISALSDLLLSSRLTMALTGAGISSESGIPTFRGLQGLWAKYDMYEYAHIDSFLRDPIKVWEMLLELDGTILTARPNQAHRALADLEEMGLLGMVVTQNVDNLHQVAGSRTVVEFHGNANRFVCLDCRREMERDTLTRCLLTPPPRCRCGGLIKPDVVLFGEPIPWDAHARAFEMAGRVDLILVIGTSAVVAPASEIPMAAKNAGATVVEINTEETILTGSVADMTLQGSAADVLSAAVNRIKRLRSAETRVLCE